MEMSNFTVNADWVKLRHTMPYDMFMRFAYAMLVYGAEGEIVADQDIASLFSLVKIEIDREREKSRLISEKNRENGRKGGRPKKNPKNPPLSEKATAFQKSERFSSIYINNNINPDNIINNKLNINNYIVDDDAHTRTRTHEDFVNKFFGPANSEPLNVLVKQLYTENPNTKTVEDIKALAEEVFAQWQLEGSESTDYIDWAKRLQSTLRIKNRYNANKVKTNTTDSDECKRQLQALADDYWRQAGIYRRAN